LAAAVSVLHTAGLEDEHLLPVINDNSANHKPTPASLAQSNLYSTKEQSN